MSHFDEYRQELAQLNLSTIEDLENLVKPLIKDAHKLLVKKASISSENTPLQSHFGGEPYFEEGESWPYTENGNCLSFVFQVFNNQALSLPKGIELIQFYYDFESDAWNTNDEGWLVKIYEKIDPKKLIKISSPLQSFQVTFCDIQFEPIKTLPDWEGISVHQPLASKLSCILNEDEPWEKYNEMVKKLIGESSYQSQLSGYPKWVQGEESPLNLENQPMQLLFQIDSEENAGLMWGDTGLIYVFYDELNKDIEFGLQCF